MQKMFTLEEALLICNQSIPINTYYFQLEKFKDNIIGNPVFAQDEFGHIVNIIVGKITEYDASTGICKIKLNKSVDYRHINQKVSLNHIEFPYKA